jgi:conjugal transfer pilus assembly protein TraW
MTSKALISLALAMTALSANAKDYGVSGTTWPIIEIDIRQLLMQDAMDVDWSKIQDGMKSSAKNYLKNLPKRTLPHIETTSTAWIDPSIVISSDVQSPVKLADGTLSWRVLVPKGTRVNPLEKYRPVTCFLFFDGADESQLLLVKNVLKKENTRIIPVEAGSGDLNKDNEYLGRGISYATEVMLQRFKVPYLPSLLYPGTGTRELFLGLTSYAPPYTVDAVLQSWPSLGYTSAPKGTKP